MKNDKVKKQMKKLTPTQFLQMLRTNTFYRIIFEVRFTIHNNEYRIIIYYSDLYFRLYFRNLTLRKTIVDQDYTSLNECRIRINEIIEILS